MSKDIKDTLKESTKDILSEETLGEIEQAFHNAVSQKASLNVEAALVKQDEDHATKVNQLLEAIDTDHTNKLERLVQVVTENHTRKLQQVIEKFGVGVQSDASSFKGTLVESISNYLDLYLEQTFPQKTLSEAIHNKKADNILCEVRKLLAVDMALAKDTIKDAILDGKSQIDEASQKLDGVITENNELKLELRTARADILLDQLSSKLPEDKKRYMRQVLGDKDEEFITENFDYTLKLFNKQNELQLEQIRAEAVNNVQGKVDPVIEESIDVVQEDINQVDEHADDPLFNNYMGELSKY